MDHSTAGIVLGGIIPAFVFGGYGVMQKQCMRAGLGVAGFFLVLGATAAVGGLALFAWAPGGVPPLTAALAAVGFALFWSLGIGLILLAVERFGVGISQLAPLYNSATLITVLLGLWLFAEWKEVRALPLLLGAAAIVGGAVIVTRAAKEPPPDSNGTGPSSRSRHRQALLIGGLLPALILGLTGPLMKGAMRGGLGTGEFLAVFGVTLAGVGLACRSWRGGRTIPRAAVMTGIATGVLWTLGTALTLVALGRLGASISQLTPLFNLNTLVVVLLGLWMFEEHRHVRPAPLVIGAVLVILGAVLVARA
jgi:drug/metabolite transporter (DMT)-like permease